MLYAPQTDGAEHNQCCKDYTTCSCCIPEKPADGDDQDDKDKDNEDDDQDHDCTGDDPDDKKGESVGKRIPPTSKGCIPKSAGRRNPPASERAKLAPDDAALPYTEQNATGKRFQA